MEKRLRLLRCPTLIIWATGILALQGDRGASENKRKFKAAIPNCSELDIPGGSMFLPQQMPDRVAQAVEGFLEDGRNSPHQRS